MRYITLFYKAQRYYGSPPCHIRDQLDAISSAFDIQIYANLFDTSSTSKIWLSIGLPGDINHELYNTLLGQCTFTRVLFLGKIAALDDVCASIASKDISLAVGIERTRKICEDVCGPSIKRTTLKFFYGFFLSSILFSGNLNDMFMSGILVSFSSYFLEIWRQASNPEPHLMMWVSSSIKHAI